MKPLQALLVAFFILLSLSVPIQTNTHSDKNEKRIPQFRDKDTVNQPCQSILALIGSGIVGIYTGLMVGATCGPVLLDGAARPLLLFTVNSILLSLNPFCDYVLDNHKYYATRFATTAMFISGIASYMSWPTIRKEIYCDCCSGYV